MNSPSLLLPLTITFLACGGFATAANDAALAGVFTDHAVLQRNAAIPVWGTAGAGDVITVEFAGQEKRATADARGKWIVRLDPMDASNAPRSLFVRSDASTDIELKDVLVGEVWLCSGQSNMAMIVDKARDPDREKAGADFPGLRVFKVDRRTSLTPLEDCSGNWEISSPETAGRFSATAFFFGRELHRELDVPVGLIVSAWSGSAIEAWTSLEAQKNEPLLRNLLDDWTRKDAAYTGNIADAEQAEYDRLFADWKEASRKAKESGEPRPKAPRRPVNPREHWHHPTVLFNGMIAPLIPYGIRGAIWYQGETNAFTEESSALYATQLPLLFNDWRARWNQADFPVCWVQLPLISATQPHWARMRESMLQATSLPNSGMVVTFDIGEERLLHPKNKQAFSHRLALWARAEVYGEKIPWSGPLPDGHAVRGREIVLRFKHATEGLVAKGGVELKGFVIAGEDMEWKPAEARIAGNEVVVSHPGIARPVAARYAWANNPEGNLFNGAGLPASPFRTDTGTVARAAAAPPGAGQDVHVPAAPSPESESAECTASTERY